MGHVAVFPVSVNPEVAGVGAVQKISSSLFGCMWSVEALLFY